MTRTHKPETPTVFLSYAWADELTALAIDQWLRDHGVRVLIDRRDFIAGNDIEAEIVRCIQNAGKVICIYSRHSAHRPYPELERRIAASLERSGQKYAQRLIYFSIDDIELPVEAQSRLAVKATDLEFEIACQELWRAVLEESAAPTKLDLTPFRKNPPWRMTKDEEKDVLLQNIKTLQEITEDSIRTRPRDVSSIAESFRDFRFLSPTPYLERVLAVLRREVEQREPSQRSLEESADRLKERLDKEEDKGGGIFGAFFCIALLEARERDMLNLCRRAKDLIEAGLNDGRPEILHDVKQQVDKMFEVE